MMADIPSLDQLNLSEIGNIPSFSDTIPQQITDKLSLLIKLGEIMAVVVIIYFVILIISKIMSIRDSHNLRVIATQVIEINNKLSSHGEKKIKLPRKEKDK